MSSSKRDKPKWQTLDNFFTKTPSNSTNSDSHAEAQPAANSRDSETSKIDDELSFKDQTSLSAASELVSSPVQKNLGPSYPDISLLKDSTSLGKDEKLQLLTNKWKDVHTFKFPTRDLGNRQRRLSAKWLTENPWLRYSMNDDALYCAPCVLFGRQESKDKLFINKVTDWSNLACFVKRHLKDGSPHFTYQAMADDFVKVCSKDSKEEPIIYKICEYKKTQVNRNRHILLKIMESLLLCGKQNIAIRGHTPERSNFMAILNSKAQGDPILTEHLANGNSRAKYTSPDIQNEIINIIGNQIRTDIVDKCNSSKFFALIADESTDVSTREQVSVCLRYIQRDSLSGDISIKEDFLDFVMTTSTKGEHLAELLIETLQGAGVNIAKMRAQGYDGAANMSGKYNGVQARISSIIPEATYVHCKSHCLNLAVVHSCKDNSVRNVMTVVQEIGFAFDYSAKRLQAFFDELSSDAATKENMEKRTKLRTLCETRWTSRADALYTFKTAFPVVVHSLERLQNLGDDKAGQHLASLMRFQFVIALVVSEHVLQSTVHLSIFLQGAECDLLEAVKECKTVVEMLRSERNDDNTYLMDIGLSLEDFKREVERWRARCRILPRDKVPTTLCQTLDIVNPALYPSIDTILCVLLTMPVASATAERSFSVLKRLKTYIRSTMRNDRLSALVAGCNNSAKTGHTQHAFPKDDRQRNLWVRFVKLTRVDFTVPTKHSAICSEHFSEECYEVDRLRFKELFGLSAHARFSAKQLSQKVIRCS
ncbi:unnamed protein product [Mytilus edulis]|uniref:THAP-type domain-containing protein n=1 Tax=Mytilus edulis TaxID=6550 RepID=A0A8S3SBU0_MYTED|nr:unnamed protein product [Mytilus edulis]